MFQNFIITINNGSKKEKDLAERVVRLPAFVGLPTEELSRSPEANTGRREGRIELRQPVLVKDSVVIVMEGRARREMAFKGRHY